MADMTNTLRTRLAPRWLVRQVPFIIVLLVFGVWGYIDASDIYPARGVRAASYLEMLYLRQAERDGALASAGIADPAREFAELDDKRASSGSLPASEQAKYEWLRSLRPVNRLDPTWTAVPRGLENTPGAGVADRVSTARDRLTELERVWTSADGKPVKAPDPLTRWDIPTQWLISALGFLLGGWMLVNFLIAARKSYRWEPDAQRLTLHDGTALVPADLVDLDKRKWHKFYVTLKTTPDHPTLRGRDVELDLFRYLPLEDWVLEMERTRFPERAAQEGATDAATVGGGSGGSGGGGTSVGATSDVNTAAFVASTAGGGGGGSVGAGKSKGGMHNDGPGDGANDGSSDGGGGSGGGSD